MSYRIAAACAALLLPGCATIMNDSTHQMRIDTVTEDGRIVAGSDCTVRNDKSTVQARSGEPFQVRRSAKDLEITCRHPGYPEATGHAVSRANAGMWGNIIAGGAVGAIVDHNKGTAYTYPTWVQLVFGWAMAFDRHAEDSGKPVEGERIARIASEAGPVATTVPDSSTPVDGEEAAQPAAAPMKWQYRGF